MVNDITQFTLRSLVANEFVTIAFQSHMDAVLALTPACTVPGTCKRSSVDPCPRCKAVDNAHRYLEEFPLFNESWAQRVDSLFEKMRTQYGAKLDPDHVDDKIMERYVDGYKSL